MSEKRYFKVEYAEEGYLFDSNTISEELVTEQAEYGYGVFANSLSPSEICERLNEQQATIEQLQKENLYKSFELKSIDDLKRLKGIFEICMVLIDYAIVDEDLEMGYESVFQFERRIKKFGESRILERVRGYATED